MQSIFNRLSSETSNSIEDKEATCFDSEVFDEQQLYERMFIYYHKNIFMQQEKKGLKH